MAVAFSGRMWGEVCVAGCVLLSAVCRNQRIHLKKNAAEAANSLPDELACRREIL